MCTGPLQGPSPMDQASVGHKPCALALVYRFTYRSIKHTELLRISNGMLPFIYQRCKKPAGVCIVKHIKGGLL